jgi:YidC/Oxa1 family membrane protein insertase
MEKRTLLAVVLSIIILFVWQYFLAPKPPATGPRPAGQSQKQGEESAKKTQEPGVPAGTGQVAPPEAPLTSAAQHRSTRLITVDTPKLRVTLGSLGGGITSVRLHEYKESLGSTEGKELLENMGPYTYLPAVSGIVNGNTFGDATIFSADRGDIVVRDKQETLVLSGNLANGTRVRKTYTFYPDAYAVGLAVETGETNQASTTFADFAVMSMKGKSSYTFKGPFIYDGRKLDQISKLDSPVSADSSYQYTGFDEGYFSFIMMPRETKPELLITKIEQTPVERLMLAKGAFNGTLYFVPNKISLLKRLDINADKIVNFGWFDIIAKPMLWGMNFADGFTHNYGIDIILLTVLIKIIFYPLSVKSYKSMKNMQKLQPKIAQLREKFKNDKEKLNQELMGIYKREGINPLGGCLPMVIQIPVFFALYRVLMSAIEFRHAPFMLWVKDLAAPEDLFTLTVAGYALPLRILPLIMGITMVIQQKMTPTAGDPMQAKMMMFMPIFFTFLFWGFPSGLVLYWLVNNVISIGQQYYINKQVA